MARKRKVNPPPVEKETSASEPSKSTKRATSSPSPPPKKRANKPRTSTHPPPKKSKAQKRPKRAVRQEIELQVKDLGTQLHEEIERNKEQLRHFGAALELALRELDERSDVTCFDVAAEQT